MGFFNRANSFIEKWMQLIMPLCVVIGFLLGDRIAFLKPSTNWLFAFACFSSAMTLSMTEFKTAFNVKAIILLMILGHAVLPAIAWLVFRLTASPSSEIFMGLMLLFAGPCATTSFIWSGIYGGNKGLSIAFVIIDTFVSILLTPFIMRLACSAAVTMDSVSLIWSMTKMVLIPSVAGVLATKLIRQDHLAVATPVIKFITKVSLLLIIMISIGGASRSVRRNFSFSYIWSLVGVFVVLVIGYALGYFSSRYLLKSDVPDAISMGFALGCRNVGLAIILAGSYFPPLAAVPPVITLFFHDIVTTGAGRVFLKVKEKQPHDKEYVLGGKNAAPRHSEVQ